MNTSRPAHPALIERNGLTRVGGQASRSELTTFVRFVATGITASVSYGLLFLAVGTLTDAPDLLINLLATVVSTILSNELQRRFTFRAAGRDSIVRGQSAGTGIAVIGLLVNSLALAAWNLLVPGAGDGSTLVLVYCVNGVVGLANFLVLRRVLGRPARQIHRGTRMPSSLNELPRLTGPRLVGV